MSSVTSVLVWSPVNRVGGVSTMLRLHPLGPGEMKEDFLGARHDRDDAAVGEGVVDVDADVVDERQEDRVAGVDRRRSG